MHRARSDSGPGGPWRVWRHSLPPPAMIVAMQDTDGNRYIWDELLRQWVPVTGAMSPAELAAEMAPTLRSHDRRSAPLPDKRKGSIT